jgi:hypothetical protein
MLVVVAAKVFRLELEAQAVVQPVRLEPAQMLTITLAAALAVVRGVLVTEVPEL